MPIKMKTPPLSTVYLYFSSTCNLTCRHCWIEPEYSFPHKAQGDLSLKEITSALDECLRLGLKSVKITGGEPFIRKDIFGLLDYLALKKLSVIIETNGTLIGEKEAWAIKKAGVYNVAVSLDGPNAALHEELRQIKGSFKKTIKGIRHLKEAGMKNIQIIMCLWRRNAPFLKEMVSLAKGLGAASLKINPIISSCHRADKMGEEMMLLSVKEIVRQYQLLLPEIIKGGFTINFDLPPALLAMEDLKKNKLCSCSIKNLLGIIADGKISICGIGKTIDKLVMGKIGSDNIKDIWENNPILKLIREDIPGKMKGVCGKCLFKSICLGKCRAEVFYDAEDLLAPFSICQEAYEQGFFPESRLMP